MPFNVNEFRSQLQYDGARPNLFQVQLTFPALTVAAGVASQKATFMAKAAQLPGSSVAAIPLNYFGREIKIPGNRIFSDWTITIINDEDFIVRNAFESWLSLINSHAGNLRDPAFLNSVGYSVNAQVVQFGKVGNISKTYNFIGMFPNDISPLDLDWGANDTVEEYSVTLSYQYWTSFLPIPVTDAF